MFLRLAAALFGILAVKAAISAAQIGLYTELAGSVTLFVACLLALVSGKQTFSVIFFVALAFGLWSISNLRPGYVVPGVIEMGICAFAAWHLIKINRAERASKNRPSK